MTTSMHGLWESTFAIEIRKRAEGRRRKGRRKVMIKRRTNRHMDGMTKGRGGKRKGRNWNERWKGGGRKGRMVKLKMERWRDREAKKPGEGRDKVTEVEREK